MKAASTATAGAALLVLLTGCSTRSLADLSTAWGIDAAPPAVATTWPDAGPSVPDAEIPVPDTRPATPDPLPTNDRDALAPGSTDTASEAGTVDASETSVPPPKVALLVGRTALGTADSAIAKRLEGLGLAPEVHEDGETATLDLRGVALVFVSTTVDSDLVGSALRDLGRPVIVSEPFLFDDFAMTSDDTGSGDPWGVEGQQTALQILAPEHPLAGGLRGQVIVADQPVRFSWGAPPASARVIAHLIDQPTRIALFAYEAGSPMVGRAAPARRVGFFLDLRTANDLGANGWALFDAAVTWCLGR